MRTPITSETGRCVALEVYRKHRHPHPLLHFDHIRGIADEAISQLADVHQPVLVYGHVDKGAETGHVVITPGNFMPAVRSSMRGRRPRSRKLELLAGSVPAGPVLRLCHAMWAGQSDR